MSEEAGKINVYTCKACGWKAITRNRDEGTTPFMIGCEAPGCGDHCYSCFYSCSQEQEPTHEWYKPQTTSERKVLKDRNCCDHFDMGGLFLRKLAVH